MSKSSIRFCLTNFFLPLFIPYQLASQNFLYEIPSRAKFEISSSLLDTTKNEYQKVDAYMDAAMYYSEQDWDRTLRFCNLGLGLAKKIGDKAWECRFLIRKGYILKNQGNYFESESCLDSAKELLNGFTGEHLKANPYLLSYYYLHHALLYSSLGDSSRRWENYSTAIQIAKKTGDNAGLIAIYTNYSNVFIKHFPDSTLYYTESALKILDFTGFRESNYFTYKFYKSIALKNRGLAYLQKNQEPEAENCLMEAKSYCTEESWKTILNNIYLSLADLYVIKKQPDSIILFADSALQTSQIMSSDRLRNRAYNLLYNIYESLNKKDSAYFYIKASKFLEDTLIFDQQEKLRSYDTKNYRKNKQLQEAEIKRQRKVKHTFIIGFAIVLLIATAFFFQGKRIQSAKKRSDELLLNILPEETAEELKSTGTAKTKSFSSVSVLFTDFKNFTLASEKLTPEELVEEINHCYSAFDRIAEKYGIEKIKTIGDSYMCAGGLPISNTTHPFDIIKAGLEMVKFIDDNKQDRIAKGQPFFELRCGIHTGPVVAGIVGIKKFAYDIWGDTVNTASRMESSGSVGKVNISGTTYEIVKDRFTCEHRGKVEAKNKGSIDMYFVNSIKN